MKNAAPPGLQMAEFHRKNCFRLRLHPRAYRFSILMRQMSEKCINEMSLYKNKTYALRTRSPERFETDRYGRRMIIDLTVEECRFIDVTIDTVNAGDATFLRKVEIHHPRWALDRAGSTLPPRRAAGLRLNGRREHYAKTEWKLWTPCATEALIWRKMLI